MIARLGEILRRRGGVRVVLDSLLVVQILHWGEHLAQMIQLLVLGWPPPSARGIVSTFDIEKIHFIWNVLVLATLAALYARGLRSRWLGATLVWATLHTFEHGFLLARALATGVEGAPGILSAGGWLAGRGWNVVGLTTWSRAGVHFAWNTVEVGLLALAWATTAGWLRSRRHPFTRVSVQRGATLALVMLIPSTVGAPLGNVAALAPVEVWVDGLATVGGLALDARGHLYVSDADAGTVTRVAPDGTRTVVARGLDRPVGLAFDATGQLLIVEERAGRIVRVEPGGGRIAVATGLQQPRWLAVGAAGVVFVTTLRSGGGDPNAILALHPDGRQVVFADDFKNLEAIVVGDDALFAAAKGRRGVADTDGAVFEIPIRTDGSAGPTTVHGPVDRFKMPAGLVQDRRGALYVTTKELGSGGSKAKDAIAKLHADGAVTLFAADLRDPQGLLLDGDGHLYVADGRDGRVLRFRAPPPPALEALPPFTSLSPFTVRGTTEAGARVDLFAGSPTPPPAVTADAVGKFAIALPLASNVANAFEVTATARNGDGLASPAAEASIVHDGLGASIVFQAPPAAGFVRQTVTVRVQATDGNSGVAGLTLSADARPLSAMLAPTPPAAVVTATAAWDTSAAADGTHTLAAVGTDRAGNSQTVTRVVIVDNTPPQTLITGGPSGEIGAPSATFTFTGTDNLTPVASLGFAWRLDGAAFSAFSPATSADLNGLAEGTHTFEVKARDLAGNEDLTPATRTFTVRMGPRIASVSPTTGPLGTLVTIAGSGFAAGATQVAFNGAAATVRSVTPTTLTTTVPLEAGTGPVTVTTAQGTATGPQPFTVTTTQDFAVQALPGAGEILQGTSTTYTISLLNGGTPFTGVATLTVGGLPAGVTGVFAPAATVGGGQFRTLTLAATPSAATGPTTLLVIAGANVDGATVTRTASVALTVAAGGRTGALGQITFADGTPVPGVRLTLAGVTATSDSGGNFRFLDVPAGVQMLGVDANAAQSGLPIYGVEVAVNAGQATQLAPLRITPPPPPERFTPIANAGAAQVITDPRFPGVSVTLPAGVTITGWDGTVKTRVAIERLSPDALPIPPPPGPTRSLYQLFFGTPMGGLPSAPLPLTLPNDQGLEPGDKAEIWYYDAAPVPGVPAGWRLAGLGTVSADGGRVVSDPGVGISRFCGACGTSCIIKNTDTQANVNPQGPRAGEPVDLGSGLMVVDKTDLVVPGRVPALLRRSYNPQDPFGRIAGFELATGPGWALSIDVVLLQAPSGVRRLILPGNSRFAFVQQPNGTFANTTYPDFAGAALASQPDGGHTLRFRDGTTWRFATGYVPRVGNSFALAGLSLLVAQTDRNGNTLTITRDRFGGPTQVTEPSGRALSLTIDDVSVGVARLLSVSDPIGRVVHYGYGTTAPYRLETVTDPIGGVTRYTYNAAGGVVSITDPRGLTFLTNDYDAQGRVIRQTQADGGVWSFAYTGPASAHVTATVTDPRGHRTIHRMDGAGFGTEPVDALGQVTRHERDAAGRVTAMTDPLGRVTRSVYDAAGNVIRITDAAGNVRTFTHDPTFNRVTTITDPLGLVTRREYDATGNLTAIVDPLGHRTTYAYDAFGQPIAATDPLGNVTRFEYDPAGNVIATVDPLGNRTVREYDAVSRLTRQLDALGRATTIGHDFLNRVETVLDGLGAVTRFSYDPNGNLVNITDAHGSVTAHSYDAMDRLATRTDPVGATESFVHDPLGNLTRHVDRKGQVAEFTYDALNRRTRSSYADATVDAAYDGAGRLVQATDSASGTILNQYDPLDRLVAQTTDLGVVTYQYDVSGRRTTMTASGGAPVSYAYDPASRLTTISQASQLVQFDHDAAGRRTRLTLPNQASTEYVYDPASRLTALNYRASTGPLGDLTYHYDATGNRIAVAGSFARTLLPAAVPAATYDPANRQLAFGDQIMTYDANGNVRNDGTNAYVWDARNRLSSLSGPASTATFAYDALGRRTRKTVTGLETRFHYDGLNPIQLIAPSGNPTNILTGLGIDEFFQVEGGDRRTLLADALGSTIAELDVNATPLASYTYEPFGRTSTTGTAQSPFQYTARENDGTGLYYYRARYYHPGLPRFAAEDPIHTPLFEGLKCAPGNAPHPAWYVDIDRGTASLLAAGRWSAARSTRIDSQRINSYAYTANDPMGKTDPSGLCASPQNPGCDWIPDLSPCQIACCNEHDRCYERNCCDSTSWGAMFAPHYQQHRPACHECNAAVVRCIVKGNTTGGRKGCPGPSEPLMLTSP
jgi:RHS repeat-associated protein